MESKFLDLSLACDDAYISLLSHDDQETDLQVNPISDNKYAEELQLQEAIMASLTPAGNPADSPKIQETGESSRSLCEICADHKDNDQMFAIQNCAHKFCTDCISRHISVIIQRKTILGHEKAPMLACPGPDCNGVIEMDTCRQVVSKDVVTMWDDAVCVAMIAPSQRFYCPYRDCSGLLVNDGAGGMIVEAECPFCRRLLCVRCNVPWHAGIGCEEFCKLGEGERGRDDLLVHDLAKQNKWRRCPNCQFYVERNEGCLHMTCRCAFQFCYGCGKAWSRTHVCPPN